MIWGKGQARPDDRGGIEWGNEESESGSRDVVNKMAIGQVAAREVEKVTALSDWYKSARTQALAMERADLKGWGSSLSSIMRVFCPCRYILAGLSSLTVPLRYAVTFAQWAFAGYLPFSTESCSVMVVE